MVGNGLGCRLVEMGNLAEQRGFDPVFQSSYILFLALGLGVDLIGDPARQREPLGLNRLDGEQGVVEAAQLYADDQNHW